MTTTVKTTEQSAPNPIKPFEDINVSTTTIVAKTNVVIDMDELFEILPLFTITLPKEIRGKQDRKRYVMCKNPPNGSIISLEHLDRLRGVQIIQPRKSKCTSDANVKQFIQKTWKSQCPFVNVNDDEKDDEKDTQCDTEIQLFKPDLTWHCKHDMVAYAELMERAQSMAISTKRRKYFRNAITTVMAVDGKLINFKVPKQGKIQLTGCQREEQAIQCVQYFWNHVEKLIPKYPQIVSIPGPRIDVIFRTVMTDIVFKLGFQINRENLDIFINRKTSFNSLLETSFGYTGVNIKIPYHHPNITLRRMITMTSHPQSDDQDITNRWKHSEINYNQYLELLDHKERQKEIRKRRNNTFLVFYSGTAIMSGLTSEYMRDVYYSFVGLIHKARAEIEEIVLPSNSSLTSKKSSLLSSTSSKSRKVILNH